jgi:hypothetical protein
VAAVQAYTAETLLARIAALTEGGAGATEILDEIKARLEELGQVQLATYPSDVLEEDLRDVEQTIERLSDPQSKAGLETLSAQIRAELERRR